MKIRFWKSASCLMLILLLGLSMTGCDSLDYRKAVQYYNAGAYDQAADLFAQLEDYEDSDRLETRCHYWIAITNMEKGKYETALDQFLALGSYEDSPARVTECNYRLAAAAFDDGDLDTAESFFRQTPDYKNTREYLRQINWQKLFDAIAEKNPGETESVLEKETDGCTVQVSARNTDQQELVFTVNTVKDMGYVFTDTLLLRFTRDSLQAAFMAESGFHMDFSGSQIGSRQTGKGKLDISTCTGETVLTLDSFSLTATDNLGNSIHSDDPADCRMGQDMTENLALLLDTVPDMLSDAGIIQTLPDIGFSALS